MDALTIIIFVASLTWIYLSYNIWQKYKVKTYLSQFSLSIFAFIVAVWQFVIADLFHFSGEIKNINNLAILIIAVIIFVLFLSFYLLEKQKKK